MYVYVGMHPGLSVSSASPAAIPDIADYVSGSVRQALSDANEVCLARKISELRPPYNYKYPARDEDEYQNIVCSLQFGLDGMIS